MKPLQLTFVLEHETKGALRHQEIDECGKPIGVRCQGAEKQRDPRASRSVLEPRQVQ